MSSVCFIWCYLPFPPRAHDPHEIFITLAGLLERWDTKPRGRGRQLSCIKSAGGSVVPRRRLSTEAFIERVKDPS